MESSLAASFVLGSRLAARRRVVARSARTKALELSGAQTAANFSVLFLGTGSSALDHGRSHLECEGQSLFFWPQRRKPSGREGSPRSFQTMESARIPDMRPSTGVDLVAWLDQSNLAPEHESADCNAPSRVRQKRNHARIGTRNS